jgi:hypothetical protein
MSISTIPFKNLNLYDREPVERSYHIRLCILDKQKTCLVKLRVRGLNSAGAVKQVHLVPGTTAWLTQGKVSL